MYPDNLFADLIALTDPDAESSDADRNTGSAKGRVRRPTTGVVGVRTLQCSPRYSLRRYRAPLSAAMNPQSRRAAFMVDATNAL